LPTEEKPKTRKKFRTGKTRTIGDKRKYLVILLVVLLTSVVSFAILSTPKSERVNEKELESYVKAYLKKYKEIVEDNFNLVHDIQHIFFKYNNSPSRIHGCISKNRGAAIVLNYDTTEETCWDIRAIDEAIEYHFWSNMSSNLDDLEIIKILKSESPYVLDSQIKIRNFGLLLVSEGASLYYIGEKDSPFKIEGPGAIVIFGELISRKGLILKGENTKQAWSTYQAGLDALKHFFWDSENRMNETMVKEIEIKHKKPLLLEKINENINSKYYKDRPEEFYDDLDELKELELSEEMSTLIWNRYSELTREPTLMEIILDTLQQAAYSITISTIVGVLVGVSAFWLSKKVVSKKDTRRQGKISLQGEQSNPNFPRKGSNRIGKTSQEASL